MGSCGQIGISTSPPKQQRIADRAQRTKTTLTLLWAVCITGKREDYLCILSRDIWRDLDLLIRFGIFFFAIYFDFF